MFFLFNANLSKLKQIRYFRVFRVRYNIHVNISVFAVYTELLLLVNEQYFNCITYSYRPHV